jgi:VacB/RNase II family 3'-5' exoribonuclease
MRSGFRVTKQLLFGNKGPFEPHIPELSLLRGLADGQILSGELFVSHHNNTKAKVVVNSKSKISCDGFINRNRALSGDRVYVKLDETSTDEHVETVSDSSLENETSGLMQVVEQADASADKSCKVVGIEKRADQRFVSRLRPGDALVQPRDTRFPAMRPDSDHGLSETSLGIFKFKSWAETDHMPDCTLHRMLGKEGSFDAEDDASLELKGLLSDPYPKQMELDLRNQYPDTRSVIESELHRRADFREDRVFSVDPSSARDLDDAISIKRRSKDEWEIGVHVADVSHFVLPDSALDEEASTRATSVYLPRKVYPMLPAHLSENLCSLLPGEDRLAVSVIFHLKSSGELVGLPSFAKSVINSKARLAYEDVDTVIRGHTKDIPKEIVSDLKVLMDLTGKLRAKRIASGSVTLDDRNGQEISFEFLSAPQSYPISVRVDQSSVCEPGEHDSHTMIEELMVLTNKIVAEKLCDSSAIPVVRRHFDSEEAVVEAGRVFLIKCGILRCDVDSIQSVNNLLSFARSRLKPSMIAALTHSILGEFNRAEYVVAGTQSSGLSHWGVGANRYMHFTSPIRRYADLIVHRKLAEIFGWDKISTSDELKVFEQIKRCNQNSKGAKEAERDNKQFYFATLVKSFGNHGMWVESIVKDLIRPDPARNIKGSISFFLPLTGENKSQSLESLGLEFLEALTADIDGSVLSFKVKDKEGKERTIKSFESLKVRAVVKNPSASIPRVHIRIDDVPVTPRNLKRRK